MNLKNYAEGKLPERESEKMTEKLVRAKLDADYKSRWVRTLSEQHGLDRSEAREAELVPQAAKTNRSRRRWWTIAAIGLLLSISIPAYLLEYLSLDQQIERFIAQDQFINREGGQKGATAQRPQLRQRAELAYNRGEFAMANDLYLQLLDTDEKDRGDYFFSGLCYLKLDEPIGAAGQLYLARQFPDEQPRFLPEIRFYLGLALYRAGDLDGTREEWAAIPPDGWRYAEAKGFLDQMD